MKNFSVSSIAVYEWKVFQFPSDLLIWNLALLLKFSQHVVILAYSNFSSIFEQDLGLNVSAGSRSDISLQILYDFGCDIRLNISLHTLFKDFQQTFG